MASRFNLSLLPFDICFRRFLQEHVDQLRSRFIHFLVNQGCLHQKVAHPSHVEGFGDTFKATYRAVYADVAAGGPAARPAYPTFADGHDEMLVNDAIAASAREGRWVAVDRG
jgi:predicted dehydrogenase